MAIATISSSQASTLSGGKKISVVSTAIAMPIMPNRLPWTLVVGWLSPLSARMKRTPATR